MKSLRGLLPKKQPVGKALFAWQRSATQYSTTVCTNLQELVDLQSAAVDSRSLNNRRSLFHRLGNQRSNARGHGVEFSDVRTYTPGDDTRHIDWRLTARCEHVMTRLYSEERDQPGYILVDQRNPMYFGAEVVFKSVVAARLAALLAWQYHATRKQLGGLVLTTVAQKIKINHSRQAIVTLLNCIVDANQQLQTAHAEKPQTSHDYPASLGDALHKCALSTPAGARVSVISDFHDFDLAAQARLAALAALRSVTLFKVVDPVETDLDTTGLLGISDGTRKQTLRLSAARSQQYRDARLIKDALLQSSAANAGCPLVEVSTRAHKQLSSLAREVS